MIHLDTNLLIAACDRNDPHVPAIRKVVSLNRTLLTSSVAWTEFQSRPVNAQTERLMRQILGGGILPFDEAAAALAGRLFYQTGSNRRTRQDTMIAATAILAGAELATVNPDDFATFVPHGLKLLPLP